MPKQKEVTMPKVIYVEPKSIDGGDNSFIYFDSGYSVADFTDDSGADEIVIYEYKLVGKKAARRISVIETIK